MRRGRSGSGGGRRGLPRRAEELPRLHEDGRRRGVPDMWALGERGEAYTQTAHTGCWSRRHAHLDGTQTHTHTHASKHTTFDFMKGIIIRASVQIMVFFLNFAPPADADLSY